MRALPAPDFRIRGITKPERRSGFCFVTLCSDPQCPSSLIATGFHLEFT
jgi:hypothetical protein